MSRKSSGLSRVTPWGALRCQHTRATPPFHATATPCIQPHGTSRPAQGEGSIFVSPLQRSRAFRHLPHLACFPIGQASREVASQIDFLLSRRTKFPIHRRMAFRASFARARNLSASEMASSSRSTMRSSSFQLIPHPSLSGRLKQLHAKYSYACALS